VLAMRAAAEATDRDDRVLVARLVAGDDSVLAQVYDTFAAMVLGVARRAVVDPVAAEDVCQEVFVQLWQHADVIDLDRCSLRGWLSVLAHRRAVDWVRRAERARGREARSQSADPGGEVVDLAELVATEDRGRQARAAVAALPAEQRRVLELAFWGGRSYREVADELGIPEGTAKSRVRLALARLAELLGDGEDGWTR